MKKTTFNLNPIPAGQKIIYTFRPEQYDAWVKIIKNIIETISPDFVEIKDSIMAIKINYGKSVIYTDLHKLLKPEKLNIAFLSLNINSKLNKLLGSNNDVAIIEGNCGYTLTNGNDEVKLHRCQSKENITLPNNRMMSSVGVKIPIDDYSSKYTQYRNVDFVDLHIFKDQIVRIKFPNGSHHYFDESTWGDYNGKKPDKVLRFFNFLKFKGEEATFQLASFQDKISSLLKSM